MSIDSVSDVFAFACDHPDYWDMLVGEDDIPELDTEERKDAFAAAREHVLASTECLLRTCLKAVQARVPGNERERYGHLPGQRVNSAPTRRNLYVKTVFLRTPGESAFYVSAEKAWKSGEIRLYATIGSSLENIATFSRKHPPAPPLTTVEGNDYYFGHLEIREGDSFAGLAERLADVAWPGVVNFVDLIAPASRI